MTVHVLATSKNRGVKELRFLQGFKGFYPDLKPIYKTHNEEMPLAPLDDFEARWGQKYPLPVRSWRSNWPELATMFKYPQEIRTLIYTTNAIENLNRQFRKATKRKSVLFQITP